MDTTKAKNQENDAWAFVAMKTPYSVQTDRIPISTGSDSYNTLIGLLRNAKHSNGAAAVRVDVRTNGSNAKERMSARLDLDTAEYEDFIKWLHRTNTKVWTRQEVTVNNLPWEGNIPLVC